MLSFLADENLSHRILRGIKRRIGDLDVVVAQKVGQGAASDPNLLAWAAEHQRILLTHDRQTIPRYAYHRIQTRQAMPGVIVVSDTLPIGEAIDLLVECVECGRAEDFANQVIFLP